MVQPESAPIFLTCLFTSRPGVGFHECTRLEARLSRRVISAAFATAILLFALWINNSSLLTRPSGGRPLLLAHRGVAQQFPLDGVMNDTCTATRIYPPRNKFIEDTITSMSEAFRDGADVVE